MGVETITIIRNFIFNFFFNFGCSHVAMKAKFVFKKCSPDKAVVVEK